MSAIRVAVIMTCHNRAMLTARCLRSISQSDDVEVRVFLNDDGSTDATADIVLNYGVQLVMGSGQDYWAGGMRRAWDAAASWPSDYVILLNDDVVLQPKAITRLVNRLASGSPRLLGGAMLDPLTGRIAYGGAVRRSRLRRLSYEAVSPWDHKERIVDVLNGNLVAIPTALYRELGGLANFTHGFADFDLSLRAEKLGYPSALAPGVWGECSANPPARGWLDQSLGRIARLKLLHEPVRGLPLNDWIRFCRLHGGPFWPLFALSPIVRVLLRR
jgi:GT2 family glycosyltransferase